MEKFNENEIDYVKSATGGALEIGAGDDISIKTISENISMVNDDESINKLAWDFLDDMFSVAVLNCWRFHMTLDEYIEEMDDFNDVEKGLIKRLYDGCELVCP